MQICIKTQSIEVKTVTTGGSVNIGNTFNMRMPGAPPREEVPPEEGVPPGEGVPPRVPKEPETPPETPTPPQVPPETPPGGPPGAPPGAPGTPPGGPPGSPGEITSQKPPPEAVGASPSFYPLRIPDYTGVGLPFYRLT